MDDDRGGAFFTLTFLFPQLNRCPSEKAEDRGFEKTETKQMLTNTGSILKGERRQWDELVPCPSFFSVRKN